MAKIALEQEVEAESFRAFINDFANSLYPAYEDASGSGNIKIVNVNMRLRVMFLAMCQYFNWTPQNLPKPFLDSEPLLVDVKSAENSEENSLNESVDETVEDEVIPENDSLVNSDDSAEEGGVDGGED